MIIATVTMLVILFGGGGDRFSFKVFEKAAKEIIVDEVRRDQVVGIMKEADNELKDYGAHVKKSSQGLKDLVANYDTTREEFKTFFDREGWRRQGAQKRILDFRFHATKLMTAEEWKAVYERAVQESQKD